MVETNQSSLTEDEADLYDRQIRLWGLESQKRIRTASVLLIGLNGLGAEFCKNIVLSGIKSLTLLDHKDSTLQDTCCQFLIPREQIGTNRAVASLERAQTLNPMVDITVDKENIDSKPDEFFTKFNVVVATDCKLEQFLRINKICHDKNVKFFCGDVYGFYGYVFSDLQSHKYVEEKSIMKNVAINKGVKKQKLEDIAVVKVTVSGAHSYPSLQESLASSKKLAEKPARVLGDMVSFFLLKVLWKFRSEVGRDPDPATRAEDLELLKKFRDSEIKELGIGADSFPDEYLSTVFSKASPVCAIVGGELAQEVIKTVSQYGEPHNNFFFFNPIRNHGIVIQVK